MQVVFKRLSFSLFAICAAMVLSTFIDDNLGWSWPTNVLRNWQEFGFFQLHGRMVYNPGGFDAIAHPETYGGMSPVCLYPVMFVTEAFGWTGLGTLAFHILLAIAVFWAIWRLTGRDNFALVAAAATIMCPGYLRWPKGLDPNALSVLPVLPYAVFALALLKKPATIAVQVGLIILTLAFMSLNWTTAWVCGPCILFLFAVPGVNRHSLITLIAVMIIAVPLVVLFSFAAKFGHSVEQAASGGPLGILAGYTWGSAGYGEGQPAARLFLRITFTNVVGLLPLWLILICALAQRIRAGARLSGLIFAPLALAVADLVIMRNYFGHHPWMAGPVLVVGGIFSLGTIRNTSPGYAQELPEKLSLKAVYATAFLAFFYGLAVLSFFRANEAQLLTLIKLVREHTLRSDSIVILKTDLETVRVSSRLDEPLDRHILVVNSVNDLANPHQSIILTSIKLDQAGPLIAQTSAKSASWLSKVADWFNRSISHRRSGDRLELADTYYLYASGQ
jgi:hypothetical protein